MATIKAATAVTAAAEAIKEHFSPVLGTLEDNVRQARRAAVRGRHTAEDLVDATTLEVRRHPFGAAAIAAGVGTVAGCVLGFAIGRCAARHRA